MSIYLVCLYKKSEHESKSNQKVQYYFVRFAVGTEGFMRHEKFSFLSLNLIFMSK